MTTAKQSGIVELKKFSDIIMTIDHRTYSQQPQDSSESSRDRQLPVGPQLEPTKKHFLPHHQLSIPAFSAAEVAQLSPASRRRYSHQHQNSPSSKSSWNESLEQLSRELQVICNSNSGESLNLSSSSLGSNSRPSSPFKTTLATGSSGSSRTATKLSVHSLTEMIPRSTENQQKTYTTKRRVSLNIEHLEVQALKKLDGIKKSNNKIPISHHSHENIAEVSSTRSKKSILTLPTTVCKETNIPKKRAVVVNSESTKRNSVESNDQVFESNVEKLQKFTDFVYPQATLRKIKVRHEETEVSLNLTLAKICRNKNVLIAQKNLSDGSNDPSTEDNVNPIECHLQQLESPVFVVTDMQQLLHQRPPLHHLSIQQQPHSGLSDHLEQINEHAKEDKENTNESLGAGVHRDHTDCFKTESFRPKRIYESSLNSSETSEFAVRHAKFFGERHSLGSCIQKYKLKKSAKAAQARCFENMGIRFKVDLKDKNPLSIGVSVDEDSGFLTVFATQYSKPSVSDSGFNDCTSPSSVGSDRTVSSVEIPETLALPITEQLHLLRLGESTKAECLQCTIEDGILHIREKENEAEFLNFEKSSIKYLPVVIEDIANYYLVVTLFVPAEFRKAVVVKTIDNILVFSGTKDQPEQYGSRNTQDMSDDDDGYEAASEMSSYSSSSFTPPVSLASFTPRSSLTLSNVSQPTPALSSPTPTTTKTTSPSLSFTATTPAIPIPQSLPSTSHLSNSLPTFRVALHLPPETITRSIEAWIANCGQLLVTGSTTGLGRRMTCNF